jgi:hypothetical protein
MKKKKKNKGDIKKLKIAGKFEKVWKIYLRVDDNKNNLLFWKFALFLILVNCFLFWEKLLIRCSQTSM